MLSVCVRCALVLVWWT